jgi:hypothetical protein
MATTIKALARGTFATSSGTIYTVPAATTAIATNITVCNTTSAPLSFYIVVDGVELFSNTSINQYTTIVIDLKQAIGATKIVTGYADQAGLKYHITGAEIA